jgi:hypothetical protein
MLFDSTYSFKTIEYAQIYFKPLVKDKPLNIYFDNIHSSDLDYKYESSYGCREEITVYTDSDNIKIVKEDYTLRNQVSKWADENQTMLIAICIGLILLIVIINIIRAVKARIIKNKKPFKTVTLETNTFPINNQNLGVQNPVNQSPTPVTQEFIANEQLEKINDDQIGGAQLEQIEAQAKAEALQEQSENNSSDDALKGKYEVFILLLLAGALLFTSTALAETSETKINQIRNNIVNNEKYNAQLDNNKDKKINLVDLIYEIGTTDALNKGYIKFHATEEAEKKEKEDGPIHDEEETDMNNMWDKVQ